MSSPAPLFLASTSRYRQELLARLRVPFEVEAPGTDESPFPDEAPVGLAMRLAEAKARAVGQRRAGALVIGSDQVAHLDGKLLGKPGSPAVASAQLLACSGRVVEFCTAVCLYDARSGTVRRHLDSTSVRFRVLVADEVARYVALDDPQDCAGSFRSEALGVALFESVRTDDPTALIGLPLIATARLLRESGLLVP